MSAADKPGAETRSTRLLQALVQIDPDEHPAEFFAALHERVDGTYVYATEPHAEAACTAADYAPRGVAATT